MTITVTVKPRSRKQELRETAPGYYEARVISAPEGGKANEEMLVLLAEHFGVAKSRILITAGASSKRKLIEIFGL